MKVWPKLLAIAALLQGCSAAPNHLGNPLTWPVTAVQSGLSNAVYDQRRAKVAGFVQANGPAILKDARRGQGPSLTAAMDLARVPDARRKALVAELAQNPLYSRDREALVVALMVHGD